MAQLMTKSIGPFDENVYLETDPDLTLGPTDLLVQMEAATINITDFRLVEGTYSVPVSTQFPFPLGTEGVGRVQKAGSAVDSSIVGQRVVILPTYLQGTWADVAVVPQESAIPVGDGGDRLQMAMLAMNPPTAYLLLNRYAPLQPGDWIGQDMGNSAVGQYVIALARHFGIKTLSVVRREESVEPLRALGADAVVVDGDDVRDRVVGALDGDEFRLVFDGVGGEIAGHLAHSLVHQGKVISYASLTRTPVAVSPADLVYRELSVEGFWLVNWIRSAAREEIEATYAGLAKLVETGVISTKVEATYGLQDYQAAFDHARSADRKGKILFTFGSGT